MELLGPSHEQFPHPSTVPNRLKTFQGAGIGLLSNGKENTAPFFDRVETILRDEYEVADVVRRIKSNYSAPAEDELMREAMGWDAVLSGVGD